MPFIQLPKLPLLLFILLRVSVSIAQKDFNNYKPLLSSGAMPVDFYLSRSEKINTAIKEDPKIKTNPNKLLFLERTYRNSENLMHSGYVTYGDSISQYVNAIAQKLLEKQDPQLLSKLRFYHLKSNEVNALCTNEGIVFVTTGLIAQMTSEAQLAFVLAHEITHYKNKHIAETFEWISKSKRVRLNELASYSKENEFEADNHAIQLFHNAGYSLNEIESVMDVIMYSYLPFEEEVFDFDWITYDGKIEFPEHYFSNYVKPITAIEDYNDELSSHPNIKKRKDAAITETKRYENWGNKRFLLDSAHFILVRDIARFECILNSIEDQDFVSGIYSIFLLHKKYPDSYFLKKMKINCLYGIINSVSEKTFKPNLPDSKHYEGEIYRLYEFLKKCKLAELEAIGIRAAFDVYNAKNMDQGTSDLIRSMIQTPNVMNMYSPLNMSDAQKEHQREKTTRDSLKFAVDQTINTISKETKYDKIRSKRENTSYQQETNSFDTSYFYLYNYGDILNDKAFVHFIESLEKKNTDTTDLSTNQDKFVVIRANYVSIDKKIPPPKKLDLRQKQFYESLEVVNPDSSLSLSFLTKEVVMKEASTQLFNERMILLKSVDKDTEKKEISLQYAYSSNLDSITLKYGTTHFVNLYLLHEYRPKIKAAVVGYTVLCWPLLPLTIGGYIPIQLIRGHRTEIYMQSVDLSKNNSSKVQSISFRNNPTKSYNRAYFNKLLYQFTHQK